MMLNLYVESIAALSKPERVAQAVPPSVVGLAPSGKRRSAWLAGRVLLAEHVGSQWLSEMTYTPSGKPLLADNAGIFFNISHSGNAIALLVGNAGHVGCDIERVRSRSCWQYIAQAAFREKDYEDLVALPEAVQLRAFWSVWASYEAVLKQRAGYVWEIKTLGLRMDVARTACFNVGQGGDKMLAVAVCAPERPALMRIYLAGQAVRIPDVPEKMCRFSVSTGPCWVSAFCLDSAPVS